VSVTGIAVRCVIPRMVKSPVTANVPSAFTSVDELVKCIVGKCSTSKNKADFRSRLCSSL
jgi:hypothetical protein